MWWTQPGARSSNAADGENGCVKREMNLWVVSRRVWRDGEDIFLSVRNALQSWIIGIKFFGILFKVSAPSPVLQHGRFGQRLPGNKREGVGEKVKTKEQPGIEQKDWGRAAPARERDRNARFLGSGAVTTTPL
jgi:hypothetical protein